MATIVKKWGYFYLATFVKYSPIIKIKSHVYLGIWCFIILFLGCSCEDGEFGCCPDDVTKARGKDHEGCGCIDTGQ